MENNLRGKVQKALNATPCPKPSLTPRQVMIQQTKLEHNKPRWASELYTEILLGFQLNQLKIVTEANAKKKKKKMENSDLQLLSPFRCSRSEITAELIKMFSICCTSAQRSTCRRLSLHWLALWAILHNYCQGFPFSDHRQSMCKPRINS